MGADLVGKVEAGIPEDDPRNPATIADNVGDNVGDVAGMGADLYESYCGSILATAALGAAAFIHTGDTVMQFKAVIAPMLIAAIGIILSIIGIFSVRTKENATMKDLLGSLAWGTNLSSALIVVTTFFHPMALATGQLDVDFVCGSCRAGCGYCHRSFDGILYFSILSSYSEVE